MFLLLFFFSFIYSSFWYYYYSKHAIFHIVCVPALQYQFFYQFKKLTSKINYNSIELRKYSIKKFSHAQLFDLMLFIFQVIIVYSSGDIQKCLQNENFFFFFKFKIRLGITFWLYLNYTLKMVFLLPTVSCNRLRKNMNKNDDNDWTNFIWLVAKFVSRPHTHTSSHWNGEKKKIFFFIPFCKRKLMKKVF